MKHDRTNGAIGALLDEYSRAVEELKTLIPSISPTELIETVDYKTTNEDCRSIETILIHVIRERGTIMLSPLEIIKVQN